jgi:polysaccharide export outer membrane protein
MSRTTTILAIALTVAGARFSLAQKVMAGNAATATEDAVSGPTVHALQISAGDLVDLTVFDTPELSTKLRVDEHGLITLPLAGSLPVAGLTADQAGRAIESRLRQTDVLKDPHVSVTVLEYNSQGVTVLGEVRNPGVYPLMGAHGLLDLLSAAGGVTSNASKDVTVTHRDDPQHPVSVKVETKGSNAIAYDIDIRPGDKIMVLRAGIVYVVGDVGRPGGFLIENNDRLTVLQAVALAQGTNRTASLNHARLIRKTDGTRAEVPIPLKKILDNKAEDQALADGDILFIPSSGAKSALRTMEGILPSAASASIYRVP